MAILFIHGFRSSGASSKVTKLRAMFPETKVYGPDLPVEPKETMVFLKGQIEKILLEDKTLLLIGSSLGGFYADAAAAMFRLPVILLNPTVAPWKFMAKAVGINTNLHSGGTFEWKKEYVEQLEVIGASIDTPDNLRNLFIADDDALLPPAISLAYYKSARVIRHFTAQGHEFQQFEAVAEEIKEVYQYYNNITNSKRS